MLACLVVGLLLALLVFLQMREPAGDKQVLVIRRSDAPSFLDNDKEVKDVHFLEDLLKSSRSCERMSFELIPYLNGRCKYVHTD